jgi:hypothetical protein
MGKALQRDPDRLCGYWKLQTEQHDKTRQVTTGVPVATWVSPTHMGVTAMGVTNTQTDDVQSRAATPRLCGSLAAALLAAATV